MKLFEKFQALMTAAAFAEEGDFRTARELFNEAAAESLKKTPPRNLGETLTGDLAVNTGHGK